MTDTFQQIGQPSNSLVSGLSQERVWKGEIITENGVYSMVPIETYHRETRMFDGFSISSSSLRTLLRRPLEYWYSSPYNKDAVEPEGSKALEFGKAAHMLLLGEDGFNERYILKPKEYTDSKGVSKPWSGNAGVCKEWIKKQADAGRSVITDTEIEHIKNIADALSKKEAIRLGILNGRIERSIFAKRNGIWLKNRPDVIPNDGGDFVDLKTAASVDDDSLSKAIFTHGYHIQAGFTRMVVREVLGEEAFASFTFVFVEKTAPYDVRVVTLKDTDIDLGEAQARVALGILEKCIMLNEWPGYDGHEQHVSWVEMPSWARARVEDQIRLSGRAA